MTAGVLAAPGLPARSTVTDLAKTKATHQLTVSGPLLQMALSILQCNLTDVIFVLTDVTLLTGAQFSGVTLAVLSLHLYPHGFSRARTGYRCH